MAESGEKFDFKSGSSFKRIIDQVKKEFRLLKTDKINMFIAIVLPPLIIILFAAMIMNSRVPGPVVVAVVNYDSNAYLTPNEYIETVFANYSIDYTDAVNNTNTLNMKYYFNGSENLNSMIEARELLENKQVQVIIIIPADFTELIMAGFPAIVEVIPDTSDVTQVQRYMNAIHDSVLNFQEQQNFTGNFIIESDYEFEIPEGFSIKYSYLITLVLGFVIFGVSCVLTILVVVQEQPIARLLLTPVNRMEILLAKYITYVIVLLIQIVLIYAATVSRGLFIRGRVIDLFIALFMMGYVGISLGMFISSVSKTKMEANQLFFVFLIIIVLLSGLFIPIDSMPGYLQFIANMLPLSHGSPMIAAIIDKGAGLRGTDFLYLLVQSTILTALSFLVMLRKNYEV